jgi:porphobilinogen synthase
MKAGEMMGWVDAAALILETLTAIKRAGADMILTYSAIDVARVLEAS